MNLGGQTSWYASPVVADLDGDGTRELIAAYYSVYVFGSDGTLIDRADDGSGRVYAPHVVVDLDGVTIDSAPWFTNRSNQYAGEPMTWGQFKLSQSV